MKRLVILLALVALAITLSATLALTGSTQAKSDRLAIADFLGHTLASDRVRTPTPVSGRVA